MRQYIIRPLDRGYSSVYADFHTPANAMIWPSQNFRMERNSLRKRWGYVEDRDLGSSVDVLNICVYELKDATRNTLFLTDADLCLKQTGGSNTFSYKTDTYTTGTVTDITGAVVTGSGTTWSTNAAVGDKFIADNDHSVNIEPDTNWGTILTVDSDTQITLSASYTGTTGAMSDTYKIRKVYTTPSNERWSWAVVNDTFCFTNGNSNVQYWDGGSGYATDLDSTNAIKARYCIEFANRLVLADLQISGSRDTTMVQWSKEGDPTDWTDSTAGQNQLLRSKDPITGLTHLGENLVIYKKDSIVIAGSTGVATSPIIFPVHRPGIGAYAPYGIIEGLGTNAFLARDDFYVLRGDQPVSIGEGIRDYFNDITTTANRELVVGFVVDTKNEFHWIATTSNGQLDFVYNTQTRKWSIFNFNDTINCGGEGAV